MNTNESDAPRSIESLSPAIHYDLAMWYKSRGLIKEAMNSFKKALFESNQDLTHEIDVETFDKSLVWLEYGKLNNQEGLKTEAIFAFQQCLKKGKYKLEGLIEWGDLLYSLGKQNSEIVSVLHNSCSENKLSPTLLANALFTLGCYKEALDLYASHTDLQKKDYVQYIQCCLHIGEFTQALLLLEDRIEELHHLEIEVGSFSTSSEDLLNLCRWLRNRQFSSSLTREQRLEMAKLAICHSLPDESLVIISEPNEDELEQIVYILYREGYHQRAKAYFTSHSKRMLDATASKRQEISFIAAEIMYDEGQLELAANHFEQIYLNDSTHTRSQFATAACYLQSTLESLLNKYDPHPVEEDSAKLLDQYMNNIYLSLQIIHHTHWHTVWSPSQRRRMSFR